VARKGSSRERAKELGAAIRSAKAGPNEVRVWLEFVPKGELKSFTRVELEISVGERRVVSAPLLPSHPTPESVAVNFLADPDYLPTSMLTIVVSDGVRSRVGYRFKLKDFIEHEKSR
jgi:hypothetical protein